MLVFVGSRLKTRKVRTAVAIFSASCLFGVVIAVLLVTEGLFGNAEHLAKETYGESINMSVRQEHYWDRDPDVIARATQLYEESTDPDKQHPLMTFEPDPGDGYVPPSHLDTSNPFTVVAATELADGRKQEDIANVAELAGTYGGRVIGVLSPYCNFGNLSIDGLTTEKLVGSMNCFAPGESVMVVDGDIAASLARIPGKRDDAIKVIVPLKYTAQIVGVGELCARLLSFASVQEYINLTNREAIGQHFTGTIVIDGQETEVVYEIVGILPSEINGATRLLYPSGIDPIADTLRSLGHTSSNIDHFIVINPESSVFRTHYGLNLGYSGNTIIASFDNKEDAIAFQEAIPYSSEFMNNRIRIHESYIHANWAVTFFTIFFAVVAGIVMASTVGRVVDDEHQTIALYRVVGATSRDILKIFTGYTFALSLLIIICSTIVGIVLAGVVAMMNVEFVTVSVSAMYNIPDLAAIILMGLDPRIFLVYLAIIVVGFACLLLVALKLKSKALMGDLRK